MSTGSIQHAQIFLFITLYGPMANKMSSKGKDGFINKAKKPFAFFRRFESIVPRGSSGKVSELLFLTSKMKF
jgi:hypothetical protein